MPLHELHDVRRIAHDGTCYQLRDTMLEKVSHLLERVKARLAELERTRARLQRIQAGLAAIQPRDEPIPGLKGSDCIRLAAESQPGGDA